MSSLCATAAVSQAPESLTGSSLKSTRRSIASQMLNLQSLADALPKEGRRENLPESEDVKKHICASKPIYICEPFVTTALVKGRFKNIAQCPTHIDQQEWISFHLLQFFQQINTWFEVIFPLCKCPEMSVGPNFNLFWRDNRSRPAFTYCDSTLVWIQGLLSGKSVFPTGEAIFPPEFAAVTSRVAVQLLMLLAHIYNDHFEDLVHLECEAHFNSLTAHYITFLLLNKLIRPDARELNPASRKGVVMGSLIAAWSKVAIIDPRLLDAEDPVA